MAQYLIDGAGWTTPEVVIPQFRQYSERSKSPIEFFLTDEATVLNNGKEEKWGKIRAERRSRDIEEGKPFQVKVIHPIWYLGPCITPPGVIERLKRFEDTINKRNRLTESLRKENRELRKRLAALS